ncbi:MAG: autotransporter outer membrane beta-barrel domain-containing protein [Rhodospirillales bacterium]
MRKCAVVARPGRGHSLKRLLLVSASLVTLALLDGEQASANPCQANGANSFLCMGNLSQGLAVESEVPTSATNVTVENLTSDVVAGGISWFAGLLPGNPATRTLTIDTGGFVINPQDRATPVALTASGFGNTPNAAGLSLNFTGSVEPVGTGTGITVANIGGGATSAGASGGTVGNIDMTLEGSIDGEGNIRVSSFGGNAASGGPGQNGGSGADAGRMELNTAGGGFDITAIGVSGILGVGNGGAGGSSQSSGRGGDGGAGGRGGIFVFGTGQADWTIATEGNSAAGITLSSRGGNGGNGSNGSSGRGGKGGNGGAAGQIAANNLNITVTTDGDDAAGIVSRSIGGDGGSGGKGGTFGNGGDGGAGGSGFLAQISGTVRIATEGKRSSGIAISSIGGTGGAAGDGGFFGGGGNGAGSGNAGNVSIVLSGDSSISTKGDSSVGIASQTIGGRGGTGGGNVGLFNFSASGGSAGQAGSSDLTSGGSIATEGNAAVGILAQSIGGGGGQGGSGFGLFYSSGGTGSIGGPGGDIDIRNLGSIATAGNAASAIQAQSISGTGGSGGASAGAFSMGGGSAKSANSGAVTIVNAGSIETGTGPAKDGNANSMACAQGCSYGILAQSIGGGGGNGGSSGGWFSVGGGAGGGGNAGVVTVTSSGSIATNLRDSTAVVAQSIGGGGGNGGAAVGAGVIGAVAVGGGGGAGGSGGAVRVNLDDGAETATRGSGSHGVQAQSLGGGGGNGAFSVAAAGSVNFPGVAVSVGGTGGEGGNGSTSTIQATGSGSVQTVGDQSHGLFAQSVGGGGGNGGFSVALAASNAGVVSLGVGGSGGKGGSSGAASIDNAHAVATSGERSSPLIAQSIGGGGGNGALAISGAVGVTSPGIALSLGGSGGNGNTSGTATIANSGAVSSAGGESAAIVAQSIGGGGGNGGLALSAAVTTSGSGAVSFALGGGGGTGGTASTVTVSNQGSLTTTGTRSQGILSQSIGGGGGNGGTSISATLTTGQSVSLGGAIGGFGGAGGNGGRSQIANDGAIATEGDRSEGILAQSVGGGGGNGGFTSSVGLSISSGNSLAFSLGGSGGAAGAGGLVEVTTSGDVSTSGDLSRGILAQSIGGGGGNGGTSIAGSIATSSANTLAASIGGSGGGSGSASNVTLGANGDITTAGLFADGILAQSIGGSGGNGGTTVSASIASSAKSTQIGIGIGGAGGNAGNGADVSINPADFSDLQNHKITVTGAGSRGLVAQSIGGGGGNGGMVVTGNFTGGTETRDLRLAIGRSGGSGGGGGKVSVIHRGAIATGNASRGDDLGGEHAILAQSISGGGGDGSVATTATNNRGNRSLFLGIGGQAGSGVAGGTVEVAKSGSIATAGSRSHGILAQSIGGGGGNGGMTTTYAEGGEDSQNFGVTVGGFGGTGNSGGTVTIDNSSAVTVTGLGSQGLVAQSIGGGGGSGAANQFPSLLPEGEETTASSFRVAVGGFGGTGGGGGSVTITNSGSITTGSSGSTDDDSPANTGFGHAIVAQSIASGGGSGGIAIEGDLGTPDGIGIGIAVGGNGGGSETAGAVLVENRSGGSLHTRNDESHGILAQSIGGGGGNGASGIKGDVTNGSDNGLFLGIGGSGGGGGDARAVTVVSNDTILAEGDRSKGVLAQSIGGGGGSGDIGIEGGIEGDADGQNQLALAIGGSGGQGGTGSIVAVTLNANVTTGTAATATASGLGGNDAVLAQSIGGGGGDGGAGIAGDIASGQNQSALNLGLGGGGGGSRGGGSVQVNTANGVAISVSGSGSRGLVAQSIGGSGGNGGAGIDGSIKAGESGSGDTQVNLGIGRASGPGGAGGQVSVTNRASITTNASGLRGAEGNHAIFAQSIAGGGGNGGIGISGDIENADQSKAAAIGIGGVGSNASNGGAVQIANEATGNLRIGGAQSVGIFAQSIGGGGGNGAIGIGGGTSASEDASAITQLQLGVGGAAGGGGNGGKVTITNLAAIATTADPGGDGEEMHGIFAQSIGGGGGEGELGVQGDVAGSDDSQALVLAVGGAGGKGGSGNIGTVSGTPEGAGVGIVNFGDIVTQGDGSKGIFAQNIGGGGGSGSAGLEGKIDSGDGEAIALTLGARGGDGGNGGSIWVQNLGNVTTGTQASSSDSTISEAHGVFAQSIGGGGGSGSLTGSLTFGTAVGNRGVAMDLGASAGGGSGGTVILDNGTVEDRQIFANRIVTFNDSSHGLFAQSIGGGGGALSNLGGISTESGGALWDIALNLGASSGVSGNGGSVTLRNRGVLVSTAGDGAYGLFAQSIGGGGGDGGNAAPLAVGNDAVFTVNLGGSGSSGNAGAVRIDSFVPGGSRQQISTSGRAAAGVFAQSIGGGGGHGGIGAGARRSIAVGGSSGASGDGDLASVFLTGTDLTTRGEIAPGVVAQSIGGGGGYSGNVVYRSTSTFGSGLNMGSDGATSGNGGRTEVVLVDSNLLINGGNAPGILAQSVGGGGGVNGLTSQGSAGALIGNGGGTGRGGQVFVNVDSLSSVTTSGAQSHGIFAQSAGGAANATSNDFKVSVVVGGEVRATGRGSHGIYAQSSGTGRGPILIQLPLPFALVEGGSTSTIGAESGAAIFLKDGVNNTILNLGTIRSVSGASGVAINATQAGSTSILNQGTITGQILGNSIARIDNESGAVIRAGEIDAALIVNDGFIDVGPQGVTGTTLVVGDLDQSRLGTIEIDVDPSRRNNQKESDDLVIEGDADLDGRIKVDLLSTFQVEDRQQIVPIIVAEEGMTFNGGTLAAEDAVGAAELIEDLSVTQSGVAQYRLFVTSANVLSLGYNIDFANEGILAASNDNQDQVVESLQSLYRAQELDEETTRSLIAIETAEEVAERLNSLSSEVALDTQVFLLSQARAFSDTLHSCANRSPAGTPGGFFDDGQCLYGEVEGALYDRDATSDNLGFSASEFSFTVGGQAAVREVWNFGGAFRYANSSLTASGASSSSEGDHYFAGLSAKRRFQDIEFSSAVSFGYSSFETSRAPLGSAVSGDQDLWSFASEFRAAYLYERDNLFVKPRLGLGVEHLFGSDYQESGDSPFLLDVETQSQTYVTFRPAVEVGGEWDLPRQSRIRPHLSFGITQYLGDPSVKLNASFLGSSAQPFSSATDLDGTRYEIAGGFDLFAGQSAVVRLEGASSLSKNSTLYGGSLRVELPF